MADAAPVVAPESITKAGDGSNLQTFEQWNPQQWFDTSRWTLTGSQADSDYKAGMWWSDAQDMKAAVPGLLKHAESWTTGRGQLIDAQQKARTAKAELAGYEGASAKANSEQLDRIDRALQARMDSVEPIPAALRNTAAIINDGFPKMQALWDKWENDRANAPQCDADTQQMQPIISNMAQAMLDSANAMMVAYHTELTPPEITNGPPATQTDDTPQSSADTATPAVAHHGGTPAALSGVGSVAKAGTAPGTLVTPAAAHLQNPTLAGTATITPATHHAASIAATTIGHHGNAAAAAVSPTNSTGPQLAGTGSATLTPPSVAGAASGAAAPLAPPAAAGPGAPGIGGIAPGTAMSGGLAPFFPAAPMPGAGRRRNDDKRDDKSGAVLPPAGGAGTQRARATIRPGLAKRTGSAEAAAAAGSLRGRTGGPKPAVEEVSARRRTGNRRKTDADRPSVEFLDEDAWQTDDPGSGVISGKSLDD